MIITIKGLLWRKWRWWWCWQSGRQGNTKSLVQLSKFVLDMIIMVIMLLMLMLTMLMLLILMLTTQVIEETQCKCQCEKKNCNGKNQKFDQEACRWSPGYFFGGVFNRGPPNEKTTLVYVGNLDQQGVGRGGVVWPLTSKPNWAIRIFMNVRVWFEAFTELLLEQDLVSNPIPVQVRLHQSGRKVILHFTRKVVSEKYKSVRCKNFFSRRWDQDSCTCLCNPASRTSCSTGYIFDNTFRCSCVQVCTCNSGILVPARTDRLANTGRGSSHLPN